MGLWDLFRPKWRRSNWHVRKAAVGKVTDQVLLARIALEDEDKDVRRAAKTRQRELRSL